MLLLLFVLLLGSAAAQHPLSTNQIYKPIKEDTGYRLPINVVPISYEITIEPDFSNFTFKGFVRVISEVLAENQSITIHTDKIEINSVSVKNNGNENAVTGELFDETRHFYTIFLESEISPGDLIDISISYIGQLNKNNEGFYRAKFTDADGSERWLGTTQFQPTYARQAFPCFDEPALKATFTLNIIRPASYNSASNMNILATSQLGLDRFMDSYESTVKMSTYLVAFVVSELGIISNADNQSVYGRPEALEQGLGDFGLKSSVPVLKAIEDFTGVPYALNKMGQVVLPGRYFSGNAMENWGLVIYRESLFFYEEGVSSFANKKTVLAIMGHEYGHQWFGNLVSPLWWEFLWLNEGFATYFDYYATDVVAPEFRMMEQFVTSTNQFAMMYDNIRSKRPMTSPGESPDDIDNLFDIIAYDKSAAVIRMTEHYLSTPIFANGLNRYLTKTAFSTGTPTLLFDAFQESVNEIGAEWMLNFTVHDVFTTWHTQKGYPYINVTRLQNELYISQQRYYVPFDNAIWIIPINYATASDPNFNTTTPTHWLSSRDYSFQVDVNEADWIIINKKSTGYYRVNYDEHNWMLISYQLKENHLIIDPLNRAQLIDDSFSLAKAGLIEFDVPLTLTEYIVNEIDYIPLTSYNRHVSKLEKLLTNTNIYKAFKAHVVLSLEFAYKAHSFDKNITDHTMLLERENIYSLMCRFGYEKCTNEMELYLMKSLSTGKKIQPDLQTAVYCGGMVNDNNPEIKWEKMYQRYTEAEYGEKKRIVEGLSCSSNKNILKRILLTAAGMSKNYKFVDDDVTNAIKSVSSTSYLGALTTLEFLMENYQNPNLTSKQKSIMLNNISEGLFEPIHKEMLEKLSTYKLDAKLVRDVNEAISNIGINLQLSYSAVPQLTRYLSK